MNYIKFYIQLLSLFILPLYFVSCDKSHSLSSLIEFDSCFADYEDKQELAEDIDWLTDSLVEENPNYPVMAVVGCMNYQMGNKELSEQFLLRVVQESNDVKAKSMAASALGLIYLKEDRQSEIKPYIKPASEHHLGLWMIVLYYIDSYRDQNNLESLQSATKYMERKHANEGSTDASKRFLERIQDVHKMAGHCRSMDDETPSPLCRKSDFKEEELYLFALANGFLDILLKEEPFNTDNDNNKDESNSSSNSDVTVS